MLDEEFDILSRLGGGGRTPLCESESCCGVLIEVEGVLVFESGCWSVFGLVLFVAENEGEEEEESGDKGDTGKVHSSGAPSSNIQSGSSTSDEAITMHATVNKQPCSCSKYKINVTVASVFENSALVSHHHS